MSLILIFYFKWQVKKKYDMKQAHPYNFVDAWNTKTKFKQQQQQQYEQQNHAYTENK